MQDTVEKRVNEISRMDETITENTLPVAAKIEICGKCTLDCKFCFNHTMKTIGERQKIMNFHDFLVVLNFLKTIPTMKEVGLFYMGESALNPNMAQYYRILKESEYFTFLTTNGTILRTVVDSIPYIDSLKVSWNYKDVKDFKRKTGHNDRTYNTIIENIKTFRNVCLSNGKKLAVSTVLDGSKDEYQNALSRLSFDEHYWIPLQTQCGVEKNGIGGVVGTYDNMRKQIPCWSLFKFLYVDVNLNVRTCCYGHHEQHKMYNLREIDRYVVPQDVMNMRRQHLSGQIPVQCRNCVTSMLD